ncbi:MAG: cytochrome c3 family protein, partial [Bacillota bacterium]|nr:cytochrome c3 family protein [Bacillota bacterium]
GTDLRNDHPIAIPYLGGSGLAPVPQGGVFPNGVRLVNGQIECVTCHNVHDPAIKPFLRTDNSRSALCLTCHVK